MGSADFSYTPTGTQLVAQADPAGVGGAGGGVGMDPFAAMIRQHLQDDLDFKRRQRLRFEEQQRAQDAAAGGGVAGGGISTLGPGPGIGHLSVGGGSRGGLAPDSVGLAGSRSPDVSDYVDGQSRTDAARAREAALTIALAKAAPTPQTYSTVAGGSYLHDDYSKVPMALRPNTQFQNTNQMGGDSGQLDPMAQWNSRRKALAGTVGG